jgi:CRP/FNR family transcriptional regulator, cyclic AMP receptor protein
MIEIADLARIPMFRDLSADELETIKHLLFERSFKSGTLLFMEGMQGEVFYLVKQGRIEILKKKDGQDIVIATLGPGEFVGEMAVLDNEPRSAAARVSEDSVLLVVTKKCFQEILKLIPACAVKILMFILHTVNQRLREANRRITAT